METGKTESEATAGTNPADTENTGDAGIREDPEMAKRVSEYMLDQCKGMYKKRTKDWGTKGDQWLKAVHAIMEVYDCASVLDYGAGRAKLGETLKKEGVDVQSYEPAFGDSIQDCKPADLVVCTHVLEHVEKDCMSQVLEDFRGLAKKAVFVVVDDGDSSKVWPDGRNSNLNQKDPCQWVKYLRKYFSGRSWDFIRVNRKMLLREGAMVKLPLNKRKADGNSRILTLIMKRKTK